MRICAWVILVLSTLLTASTGLAVAAPSVVINRSLLLWFACYASLNTLALLVILPRLGKLFGVLCFGLSALCLVEGWGNETSRFSRGQGGGWLEGFGFLGVLQLLIPVIPLLFFWAGKQFQSKSCPNE
jgi:hypothetical protein